MSDWLISDEELGELHRHCYSCFKRRCNNDGDACPPTPCPMSCGALYHGCKEEEHLILCPLARVPCLNVNFGCDQELVRRDLHSHLTCCPASIVACTQEWNRYPLHCRERLKTVPFRQRNPQPVRGQLDYELAIRDQDMVGDFCRVPRKTKLALRNNLTRRFPALPLPPHSIRKADPRDRSLKSLREVISFEVSDDSTVGNQYGIAKLFLKNQEKQTKRWQEDVDQAILRTGQPLPKKYWEYPDLERGNIHDHCAHCFNVKCGKDVLINDEDSLPCCSVSSCQWGCGAVFHHCKSFEHKMICPEYEEETNFDWMNRNRLVRDGASPGKFVSPRMKKVKVVPPPLKPFPDLLTGPTLSLPEPQKFRLGRIPPAPPPPPSGLQHTMRFDIKVETVTRLQQKPRAMYTFLCGAELRRDQWEFHCKNVHSDIHGGLNNWIEARCPLASYGCGFSVRRLYPGTDSRAEIVYSQAVRSFGIKPPPQIELEKGRMSKGRTSSMSLTDLPTELLQCIFGFLDQWSISNAALTCHLMREVASSLLDEKGCVALQWEKVEQFGHKPRWEVAYKRWFFSNYFQPVLSWGVNADGEIAEHLKKCPYFIRNVHVKQDKNSKLSKNFMEALSTKLKIKSMERPMGRFNNGF